MDVGLSIRTSTPQALCSPDIHCVWAQVPLLGQQPQNYLSQHPLYFIPDPPENWGRQRWDVQGADWSLVLQSVLTRTHDKLCSSAICSSGPL